VKNGSFRERAVAFTTSHAQLIGVLHTPDYLTTDIGVIVVVGGPQYRVGSHRQFVLLARDLAAKGIPVLRFDYSGMGDSGGKAATFEQASPDIGAAIDFMLGNVRGLSKVCLWGLCDAASAALMYAHEDPRVARLLLLNPWVRTDSGLAQAYIENYYGRRLRSAAFWRKVLGNPAALLRSARDFVRNLASARSKPAGRLGGRSQGSFLDRMRDGAAAFGGPILILLSGRDTVATEFELMRQRDSGWAAAFDRGAVDVRRLDAADHTFSTREWRDWVAANSAAFVAEAPKP
jgi:exosortase A-associated hydrolase 1